MKRLRIRTLLHLALSAAAALVFAGCPTDSRRGDSGFREVVVTFRMDPVPADHPFCSSADTRLEGTSEAECRATGKYRLFWERPEDTVGFREYRIYLDTTPPNSTLPWQQVQRDRSLASFVLEGTPTATDSIIFVLSDTGTVPTIRDRGAPRMAALDTSGRLDASGRLVFAILTAYGESGRTGLPRYTWVITNDRFPPFPPQPAFTPRARTLDLAWERPRDPTSFFEPEADSGIVRAYFLRIFRSGIVNANRPGNFDSVRVTRYVVGGVDRTAEVDSAHFVTLRGAPGRLFRLPDSARVFSRNVPHPADSLFLTIAGLLPQDTVDVSFWAMDSAGNVNREDSTGTVRIIMTDTTQPTRPVLTVVDSGRNGFTYTFTASRDLVPSGGGTVPAATPNANILEYRLTRTLVAGPGGNSTDRDTTWPLPPARRGDSIFTDTARHLPPGSTYRITARAIDSSGHVSEIDTVFVSTLATRFPGPDSALTCPPGFVAIPAGRFLRGDTTNNVSTTDEQPARMRTTESYCIEAREHRDSAGEFVSRVTWQQAHDICQDLSQSMTPADSTWLCTEAEWERACEGAEPDVPLVYGMQSERRDPGGIRFICNIGTGDSAMALDAALRDPACITYDGVYDMSGNLAEWVLDGHTLQTGTRTLAGYPETPDTLRRGVPHTSPNAAGVVRGFRGTHYLNPGQSPAQLLRYARCSNRDYATQSRPQAFPGCINASGPQLVVTYNGKPPRCLPLPDTISASRISQVSTARDSSQILLLLQGEPQPVVYQMPFDTAYAQPGLRPAGAELSRRTLAVVRFTNTETSQTVIDTLSGLELLNASPVNRALIFQREAAPPWSVVTSGGEPVIDFLYAYVQTRNVPAKAYYSNRALGFRCCAAPRAPSP